MKYKPRELASLLLSVTENVSRHDLPVQIDKFLTCLKKINALGMLPRILNSFDKEWNKKYGVVRIEVVSTEPLTKAFSEKINEAVGGETEIQERFDRSLLGGIKLMIDDLLIDASLKRRIENLKQTISS